MKNQNKINELFEEYSQVVQEATHAHENGEDCSKFDPWLQTYVDAILALKNAN